MNPKIKNIRAAGTDGEHNAMKENSPRAINPLAPIDIKVCNNPRGCSMIDIKVCRTAKRLEKRAILQLYQLQPLSSS